MLQNHCLFWMVNSFDCFNRINDGHNPIAHVQWPRMKQKNVRIVRLPLKMSKLRITESSNYSNFFIEKSFHFIHTHLISQIDSNLALILLDFIFCSVQLYIDVFISDSMIFPKNPIQKSNVEFPRNIKAFNELIARISIERSIKNGKTWFWKKKEKWVEFVAISIYCSVFYIDRSMEMAFGPEKIGKTVISWLNSCSFNTRIFKIVSFNVLADSTVWHTCSHIPKKQQYAAATNTYLFPFDFQPNKNSIHR